MTNINNLQEFINNRLEWEERGMTPIQTVKKQAMSPVFILCPARSGSTLLRVMLAGSPDLFAPPELELLSFANMQQRKTGLSVRVDFMLEGLIRATMALKSCSAAEAKDLLKEYEDKAISTAAFYETLQTWSGDRRLVDKSVHYAMSPLILERAEQYFENAQYIHLARHPYGTIESIQRLEMHKDLYGTIKGFSDSELAEYTWQICHSNILSFLENIPQERQVQVRFEDLVTRPEATTQQLCTFLQIPFHEGMLQPHQEKQQRMTDTVVSSTMIGDPTFHQRKQIDAKAAQSWLGVHEKIRLSKDTQQTAKRLKYWDVSTPMVLQAEWLSASPLTAQQWTTWLETQRLESPAELHSQTWRFDFPKTLQVERFQQAFQQLIQQSEVLRTVFYTEKGIPQYRILSEIENAMEIWDNPLQTAIADKQVVERKMEISKSCFDSILIPVENGHWQWYFKIHDLIVTDLDVQTVLNHLVSNYQQQNEQHTSKVPTLSWNESQYEKQLQYLKGDTFQADTKYWQSLQASDIQDWYGNTQRQISYKTRLYTLEMSDACIEVLQQSSNEDKDVLLATALAITLQQIGQANRIGIGMSASPSKQTISTEQLPVILALEQNQSIQELLQQVQNQYSTAQKHRHYVPPIQLEQPLYQVAIQHSYPLKLDIGAQSITAHWINTQKAASSIVVHLQHTDKNGPIKIVLEANEALFSAAFIELLAGHYQKALEQVLFQKEKKVAAVSLLTDREIALYEDWNSIKGDFPADKTIAEVFESQVQKTPDHVAVIFEDKALTYRQLNEKANQLGHYLRETYEIVPDDVIALQLERSEWLLIAILGVIKSGAAYLPIAPDFPAARINYMLEDSAAKVLLTDAATLEIANSFQTQLPVENVEDISCSSWSRNNLVVINSSDSLFYILYTSGSTGQPKGLMNSHSGPINMAYDQIRAFDINPKDKVLLFANYTFDAAIADILFALFSGAKLVVAAKEIPTSPTQFLQLMTKHQISIVSIPPAFLASVGQHHFPDLRVMVTGGESPRLPDVKYYRQYHRYINAFGPTECSTCSNYYEIPEEIPTCIPIGKPISNTQQYILDAHQNLLPIGVVGELCISGVGLGRGYLNKPERTAKSFIPHPFMPGERLYKTGDLARWLPDGNIEFLGRKDFQLKIRGYRIEAEEIEKLLMENAAIKTALVVGQVVQTEGEKELIAYLIPKNKATLPDTATLRQFVGEKLPNYMVPSYFVSLDSFSINASGKVDIKALPAPDVHAWRANVPYVAPTTPVEKTLIEIWQKVLKVEPIGIHDDFFDLGGHSLKAIQISMKMSEAFYMELPVKLLFSSPTVATLSKKVGEYKYGDYHFEEGISFNPEAEQTLFVFPIIFGLGIDYEPMTKFFPNIRWYCFDFLVPDNRLDLYYQQIKKQQPDGPYVFFGHSVGGSLAFEMARYMENKGEEVSDIILGDSLIRVEPKGFDFKAYLDDFFAHWIDTPLGKQLLILIQNEKFYQQTDDRLTLYNQFINKLKMTPPTKANIHQIKAMEEDALKTGTLSNDWSAYTSSDFKVYPVPGSHGTIFEEPNILQSAKIIKDVMATVKHRVLVNT